MHINGLNFLRFRKLFAFQSSDFGEQGFFFGALTGNGSFFFGNNRLILLPSGWRPSSLAEATVLSLWLRSL
jgi:hypothetical protein